MAKARYDVGYGKPPVSGRFKKGRSGNPNGRPKQRPSFVEKFAKELSSKQTVNIAGQQKKISNEDLLIKAILKHAFQGKSFKAMEIAMDMAAEAEATRTEKGRRLAAAKARPEYTLDDLRKMSTQEVTDLYRRTLAEGNAEYERHRAFDRHDD